MPKETKPLEPKKIETTIHLSKAVHNERRHFRAEKAIKAIIYAGQKLMRTETVKIDQELNRRVWIHGKNCPPARVRVVFERKPDEDNTDKMITIASFKNVPSFKNIKTESLKE